MTLKEIDINPRSAEVCKWKPIEKILFRFFFILYSLTIFWLLSLIPWQIFNFTFQNFLYNGLRQFWKAIVPPMGKIFFNIKVGSDEIGDGSFAYIQLFIEFIIAGAGCIIWSLLDKKRLNYSALLYWLKVYVRYNLASTMFYYGFHKIFLVQFSDRIGDLERLVNPYGNFSSQNLFATFMGYSDYYQFFTGCMEVIAAFMILFRRTTTFGSFLLIGILTNIFLLNHSFGFGVTTFSFELLVMAIFLLGTDYKRVVNFFLLNKQVTQATSNPALKKRWMRIGRITLKIYFIAYLSYLNIKSGYADYTTYRLGANPPLYGIYKVKSFTINKDSINISKQDSIRWRRMVISFPMWANVHLENDSIRAYNFTADTIHKHFVLTSYKDTLDKYEMNYNELRKDELVLWGRWRNDSVFVQMKKEDINKYRITKRDYNWINE